MSGSVGRHRWARPAGAVGLALWVGLPVCAALLVVQANLRASEVEHEPAWVPVAPAAETVRHATLSLRWEPGPAVLAPAWTGTVQSVAVAPGATLAAGDDVATIDGVRRIAWHAPGAFYRPVQRGDRGADVAWLKTLLASVTAIEQTPGEVADRATERGIRALAGALGAGDLAVFDPGWVVYLPATQVVVATVPMQVGAPAPAAGAEVAAQRERLAAAYVMPAGSAVVDLGADDDQHAAREPIDLLVVRPDEEVRHGDLPLALAPERDRLAEDGLGIISGLVPGQGTSLPVVLHARGADGWSGVPAAALAVSVEGMTVVCARGDGLPAEREVEVVASGDAASVVVVGDLAGLSVRVPGPSTEQPCRSS